MKKVLIINTIGMGYEGISSVILNYIQTMNKSELSIHFVTYPTTKVVIKEKLNLIGTCHVLPDRAENTKGYLAQLHKVIKNTKIEIVHINGNSGTMLLEVMTAKACGVKTIITHCHNTTCDHPYLNALMKPFMIGLATDRVACSRESGRWLYGKHKHIVLNNAIELKRFAFDEISRDEVRKELRLEKELVVGHVGSFIEQKNHDYLIDIFYEFQKIHSNSVLMLISDGPKLSNIKEKVKDLGISDKVLFLGRRGDIDRLYQAMDAFVLPSKWEGLPCVMIEAQAMGLPVFAADTITQDAKCTSLVHFLSLNNSPRDWANLIERELSCSYIRAQGVNAEMCGGIFDINNEADRLRRIYLGE